MLCRSFPLLLQLLLLLQSAHEILTSFSAGSGTAVVEQLRTWSDLLGRATVHHWKKKKSVACPPPNEYFLPKKKIRIEGT